MLIIACGTDFTVRRRGHSDDFCERPGEITGRMESNAQRNVNDFLISENQPALRLADAAPLQVLNRRIPDMPAEQMGDMIF